MSREKFIPLDTIVRTTEHVIKEQFGLQCFWGTDRSDRGQIALELEIWLHLTLAEQLYLREEHASRIQTEEKRQSTMK